MLIYEIILAVFLALLLVGGATTGLLYNLLNIYLIARLVTEAIRFYIAYQQNDFLFAQWPHLGKSYWLPNLIKSAFFAIILYMITDRFMPLQLPPNTATWAKTQMIVLPLLSIALLWIPVGRSNWPQTLVMALGCIGLMSLLFMQGKTQFKQAVTLNNPLQDRALIMSAGFSPFYNHHFMHKPQRYAVDMVLANYNRHARQQGSLEHYPSFGAMLYAPASGEVIAARFDLPDQPLNSMDREQPVGNFVVIKMDNDRYVLMAHLKQHSGLVALGDRVRVGDSIAELGNSGNSSEPHLHIQVQNHPAFDEVTETYPIYFEVEGEAIFSRSKDILR